MLAEWKTLDTQHLLGRLPIERRPERSSKCRGQRMSGAIPPFPQLRLHGVVRS